tara:strand:+ start:259 stop:567 length:309 start_codon:yes stop_codon:yes gene_type:complete
MIWKTILKSVEKIPYPPPQIKPNPPPPPKGDPNMEEYRNRKYQGGKLEYENPFTRKFFMEPQKRKEVMNQIRELQRQIAEKKKELERYSQQERQATGMFRND